MLFTALHILNQLIQTSEILFLLLEILNFDISSRRYNTLVNVPNTIQLLKRKLSTFKWFH